MPLNKEKLFCVIPAFNEERNIAAVVSALRNYFGEVVVVDDGSADRTETVAAGAGAVVLRHLVNRGQGAALETGNEYARRRDAEVVVHFDADGQFDPADVPRVLEIMDSDRADMVFGSRFLGLESNMPASKRMVIYPLARAVNRIFFDIRMSDPQIGFRAFNRRALHSIYIELDGFAHCTEIMHKTAKHKLRVKEIPVKVKYSKFGLNFFDGVRIFKDLLIAKMFF